MENWLRKNREILNLRAIERKLGCKRSTISKVANSEDKKLREELIEPLRVLAIEMAKLFVEESASGRVEIVNEGKPKKVKGTVGFPTKDEVMYALRISPKKKPLSSSAIKEMVERQKTKKGK